MATRYPDQIDDSNTLPPANGSDATSINDLIEATEAIETELGVTPSGVYADVRTRLDILETRINNPLVPAPDVLNPFFISGTGVTIQTGSHDPNTLALPPASAGSLFLRQDGYSDQSLYTFGTDGYWHQVSIFGISSLQNQTTWFIDSVNGNDRNDGLTSVSALKTAEELYHRVGPVWEISQNTTITLLNSLLTSDTLHLENIVNKSNATLSIKGIEKVVASGTFTNVRQFNHAGNIQWGVESTDIGSFAPHIKPGRYIRKTSGAHAGIAGFWPAKDENGTMCRISQPAYRPAGDFFNCFLESLNIGDTFNIVDFPTVTNVMFGPVVTASAFTPTIYLENISFQGGFPIAYQSIVGGREVAFSKLAVGTGSILSFPNSQFGDTTLGFNLYVLSGGQLHLTYGLILNCRINYAGILGLSNYTLIQGCTTYFASAIDPCADAGIKCHTRGFGIYDSPASGLIVAPWHQNFIAGTIWGDGNAGYGVEVMPGGKMMVGGLGATTGTFFIVQGALGEMKVGGRTTGPAIDTVNPYAYTADRNYTYANFNATVAAGGFGQKIPDPLRPGTGISTDY